jgi:hypothetical protein
MIRVSGLVYRTLWLTCAALGVLLALPLMIVLLLGDAAGVDAGEHVLIAASVIGCATFLMLCDA